MAHSTAQHSTAQHSTFFYKLMKNTKKYIKDIQKNNNNNNKQATKLKSKKSKHNQIRWH
tara:strand:+ start:224 stop:400 length:177 start_codon:yes stop_codon:yes gene_type:complete